MQGLALFYIQLSRLFLSFVNGIRPRCFFAILFLLLPYYGFLFSQAIVTASSFFFLFFLPSPAKLLEVRLWSTNVFLEISKTWAHWCGLRTVKFGSGQVQTHADLPVLGTELAKNSHNLAGPGEGCSVMGEPAAALK